MSRYSFLAAYLLFMLPTYVLPYFGSNSLLTQLVAANQATPAGTVMSAAFLTFTFVHLAALLALVLLVRARGKVLNMSNIIAFPLIAAAFDMLPLLSLVPLVPTVMHVTALVMGMRRGPHEAE